MLIYENYEKQLTDLGVPVADAQRLVREIFLAGRDEGVRVVGADLQQCQHALAACQQELARSKPEA